VPHHRRSGGGLTDIAIRADRAISAEFGEFRFATALLCDLDIATGLFSAALRAPAAVADPG
jgi:hypothetical protein